MSGDNDVGGTVFETPRLGNEFLIQDRRDFSIEKLFTRLVLWPDEIGTMTDFTYGFLSFVRGVSLAVKTLKRALLRFVAEWLGRQVAIFSDVLNQALLLLIHVDQLASLQNNKHFHVKQSTYGTMREGLSSLQGGILFPLCPLGAP